MLECAGSPLFALYWALKQQVEKGPVDQITQEARYSLSEQKLIRQSVTYQPLNVYVSGLEMASQQEISVRVLDVDTITQVQQRI